MGYTEGFVVPVPTGDKAAYLASTNNMTAVLKRLGATRVVECWGGDLADGHGADADSKGSERAGANVVLGWVEWPSKEVRDQASLRSKILREAVVA